MCPISARTYLFKAIKGVVKRKFKIGHDYVCLGFSSLFRLIDFNINEGCDDMSPRRITRVPVGGRYRG